MSSKEGFLIVLYDIPMLDTSNKKSYNKFKKMLKKKGFLMLQKSVYFRYIRNMSLSDNVIIEIKKNLSKNSIINFIKLTVIQFEKMNYYSSEKINITDYTSNIRVF